jgi:hypothetical protein
MCSRALVTSWGSSDQLACCRLWQTTTTTTTTKNLMGKRWRRGELCGEASPSSHFSAHAGPSPASCKASSCGLGCTHFRGAARSLDPQPQVICWPAEIWAKIWDSVETLCPHPRPTQVRLKYAFLWESHKGHHGKWIVFIIYGPVFEPFQTKSTAIFVKETKCLDSP